MKVLLKVGYHSLLLPNDAGLTSIVRALSKAVNADDYSFRSSDPHVSIDPEPLEISFKYIPDKQIRKRKSEFEMEPEPLALPQPTSIILGQ